MRWFFSLLLPCFLLPIAFTPLVNAQTASPASVEATQLLKQGVQQYEANQVRAAIASWEQGLTLYRKTQNWQGEATILLHLGQAYYALGNDGQAIVYYQQGLAIAQKLQDQSQEKTALAGLGEIYYFQGDYTKAIDYQQRALMVARKLPDRASEVRALRNLGLISDAQGNYGKAVEYHQQSLVLARQLGDRESESIALRNLGMAHYFLSHYAQAIALFQQDLAIARQRNDRAGEGWLLGNLAISSYYLGDYPKAIEYQQQRLTIARELNDPQGQGMALGGLGIAHYYQGDYTKAIAYQQQSLAIARQLKDRQSEAAALANLGNTYFSLGEYRTAVEFYQQSLAIAQASEHPQSVNTILGNLGRTYSFLGNFAQAIAYHQQSLTIARQLKDRQAEGVALGNLGTAYHALGDYRKANEHTQQWLTITRQIGDRQGEAAALDDLGLVYHSLKNYPQAIAYYEQSLAIARRIHHRQAEGLALDHLGYTLFKSGKLDAAAQSLESAIQVWEALRTGLNNTGNNPANPQQIDANKISLFETQIGTYRTLQEVLIAQNQVDAALEVAERGRARAFAELLANRVSVKSQKPAGSGQRAKGMGQGIGDIGTGGHGDMGNKPLSPSPFQHSQFPHTPHPTPHTPHPPTIEQIRQIAKRQNATLIEYSIIYERQKVQAQPATQESALYIWVIQPTGTITFRQLDLNTVNRQPSGSPPTPISLTFRPEPDRVSKQLKQLHQLLIQPIADLLPPDPQQPLILIPQGSLFLVPFAALRDSQGKYLIEKHTLLTAPSIQVLEQTAQLKTRGDLACKVPCRSPALVVGNPVPMPQSMPALPEAEAEAEAVAKQLKASALTRQQATKAAVLQQMPLAGKIHFATHGTFDSQQGLKSAIALAPGAQDDGLLTAEQILELNLRADLVVLSACNTGRGRVTGDGVIGLSRSLITAGVPSVVVSLWAVPDSPTAFLMTEFYRNLDQTSNRAQALRQAMLTTLQLHSDPLAWAAFTLIGAK
ncbi:tetratricopeptide repeat protein [Kovacikia minuta CCNUW1]|uniref:CHAT domain-containing tetratricopeptide repeat protein n=1 Tax=Kovacikia minuta TaxID=2931930 RepID=UPI001CCE0FEE|nr:CHAT domain-containing protein [Kovacikia minuta]UBF25782.1 tetratricopeptide repeat protein [Kovacikia minuta CCNUW1]